MKFFYKLELKYGKYAIQNLMTYLTALYAAGLVISLMIPQVYIQYLSLDVPMILRGQIWRLVSWLMYPPSTGILFGALMLFVYYSIGTNLERVWGSFRFNVFLISGFLFHILAAFVIYWIWGPAQSLMILTPANLNLSILLAFILTFPDTRFLLFFFIPVKAKWLGIAYAVLALLNFVVGSTAQKITLVLSLLNVILYMLITGKLGQAINNVKNKTKK